MVDLNPLHYIDKFNHMFGDTVADGLEFLGITDPAVDPDGVREIAKKWRALAKGLDDAAEAARKSLADVEWEGKAAKALHKRAKSARKQATEMADSLREGAKALDDFADKAHELLSEIGVILVEIAELELAGLALSVLTGGTSAVVSTLMAGSRAAKVVALVARIEQEGTVLASAIRGVMEVIRAVERALKTLKEIRGVAAAGKMAKEGMKFSAFDTLLRDPEAFKDPGKLAGILTEGALLGVGFGALGKALGKGLKALKPAELAKLSKGLKLNCATFERLRLNPGFNKLPASIRNEIKKFVRDPIDVATGDMVLARTDVSLPGVLPLILERTHLSSYRWGGWFGPSWASTLDQRVQADDEGIVYAAPDGARICFPFPDPETGKAVRPETGGSRLTLAWDDDLDGAVRIIDPDSRLAYVFHSPVPAADDTTVDLPLQHIEDRNGNRITIAYAAGGDIPTAVIHSAGYRIAIDHHPALARIVGLRLLDPMRPESPGTPLLAFTYDRQEHLVSEVNSSGLPMRYTYDAVGRITSWADRNSTMYRYTYDDAGRVVATDGTGNALSSTLTYDDATRSTRVTDSVGYTRVYVHDEALRLTRETDQLGHVTEQEWDEDLQLVAVIDPLGHTTRYGYDELGRTVSVTRPDGRAVRAVYNELGLPTTVTQVDGTEWQRKYDERGNLISVTDPSGAVTRSRYNESGHLTAVVDALGHTVRVHCNSAGLPECITDPLGATTHYARDAFGRPVVFTDPLGNETHMLWNIEGKPTRRSGPDGSTESWTYDGEGNCVSHTDAMGGVSLFEYTHFDLMSARTGPDDVQYQFTYDAELRVTTVANPQGLTWTYTYDSVGNLIAETDFDGRTRSYTYDAVGHLCRRTDPLGCVVEFQRNELGQVTQKNAAGQVTAYEYHPTGPLAQASGPGTTLSRVLDSTGRILSESVNDRTVTHLYDKLGRRTGRTTPVGAITSWTYDAAGNRIQMTISGRNLGFVHDPAGRELTCQIGSTLGLAHTYDRLGRLSAQSVTAGNGHQVQERAYTYRADGSLSGVEDQLSGTRRFDLDPAGRVTVVHAAEWTESYAYDAAGNQTSASWPSAHPGQDSVGERRYQGTRVTRAGNVRYEHDALGRIVLRQKTRLSRKPDTWRYEWDAEDRLVQVTTPDGTHWRYTYDPLGRRTAKFRLAHDGETVVERVDFTWDDRFPCEQTTVSPALPNPVTLTWDHQGLRPIAQTERVTVADAPQEEIDSRFFAIVTDLVGTPCELVGEQGDIAWRARSTLWGVTAWTANSLTYTPLRFPGQYYDPETGLHYNYFRHYDPETARYLTSDPLGLEPAPNPLSYVHNPLTWSDPLGLAPRCLSVTGKEGKDVTEDFISGSADGKNLADQLRRESSGSIFNADGWLTPQALKESRRVIPGDELGNPGVRELMISDGSRLSDWGKYTTRTHQSPYGDYQVHYYYNPVTGRVLKFDYKVIMNRR
ncbi:DUF6531 domain-containing protein [Streptomyces sp. AC512_CC834]|uniref:DUF6531 domain-containing protein n=1 Tax=Streptomyces sp. AC512_CC834 TaxID=2823691 RepID=UPI001C25F96D|nr:DUF6531 domain-containing protein [Streptomyces sp. AC512_CC834]